SDINGDRQRLHQLGVPVASPELTSEEMVHWLQTAYLHKGITADSSQEFSQEEHQFLQNVDTDHLVNDAHPTDQTTTRRSSGRRAAPYDPATDVPHKPTTAQYVADESVEPTDTDRLSLESVPGQTNSKQAPVGQVTAVWGPIGAPGVTTVAVSMA